MFCLPKSEVAEFLKRIKSGDLNPEKLSDMTSAERRAYFAQFMSDASAEQTNALFESKLLLKKQQQGIINWAKTAAGITPQARRDIISRVDKMTEVLNPENERDFLADLAAHKLNATVTMEEAARISDLARAATSAKTQRDEMPSPENILRYGRAKMDFGDYLDSLKSHSPKSLKNVAVDIINIPKSALTSILHLSAMGVQGWGMVSTQRFWEAAGQQFRYFAKEDNYRDAQAMISGHPDYDLSKKAGLALTSIDRKLNDREEAIQSSMIQKASEWLSKKTGIPDLVRASSRAFTGFLDYTRFYRFEDLLNAARLNGEDVRMGSQVTKDLAKVVNDFTGRGDLPGNINHITAELNALFFSPRKIAATVSMFNPMTYLDPRTSPTARMAALRQLTGSLIVTGTVLGLARMAGASVNLNPISTNFGKVKIGKTTFDMTGGNANYVRLLARIIENKEQSFSGRTTQLGSDYKRLTKSGRLVNTPFKAPTRADEFMDYLRSHLSPAAGMITDWMVGQNAIGQPVTVSSELKDELTPIVFQNFMGVLNSFPRNAMAMAASISGIFGVGVYTEPQEKKPAKQHRTMPEPMAR